jgi:hypothetical protein
MTLCNQGCGTHVFFKEKRPYNVLDKKKHVCPMLEMAKLWGGYYDTIPMGIIQYWIVSAWDVSDSAYKSRNIDDILSALETTIKHLKNAIARMDEQHKKNTEWAGKLEGYKKKLVDDQDKRERAKGHVWKRGDEV